MKSGQVGYVLLALIALAIAGVIVRLVSAGGGDETLSGLLPVQRDVIDRVTIRSTTSEAILVRRGDAWTIGTHPAFQPKLDQMWSVVDEFEGAQLVSSNPANHERMGVDPRQGTEIIFFLGQAVQEGVVAQVAAAHRAQHEAARAPMQAGSYPSRPSGSSASGSSG